MSSHTDIHTHCQPVFALVAELPITDSATMRIGIIDADMTLYFPRTPRALHQIAAQLAAAATALDAIAERIAAEEAQP